MDKMGNPSDIKLEDVYNIASSEVNLTREKYKRQIIASHHQDSLVKDIDVELMTIREIFPLSRPSSVHGGSISRPLTREKNQGSRISNFSGKTKTVKWNDHPPENNCFCQTHDEFLFDVETSRPNTAIFSKSLDYSASKSHDSMSIVRYRSAPSGSQCIRSESRVNPDLFEDINPMSRHICDVLGPVICHICGKIRTRNHSVEKCASLFPSIHVSEEHFKKALLLRKYMPELSTKQLQEKVSNGDVEISNLRQRHQRPKSVPRKTPSKRPKPKPLRSNGPDGTSWMFFTDIKHLDSKISSGALDAMADAMPEVFGEYVQKRKERRLKLITNQIMPSFMKTEEQLKEENSNYRPLYYEPPVLTMTAIRDRAKHDFFVGPKGGYKLPQRLPEHVIPPEVTAALEELYDKVRRESKEDDDTNVEDALKRIKQLSATAAKFRLNSKTNKD